MFTITQVFDELFKGSGSIFFGSLTPISDITIMCSSTTGCNVMDHVKTQLPYCLVFAAISFVPYLVAELIL